MKTRETAVLLGPWLLLMLCVSFAIADDNVGEQLKSDYLDKILTLRHFYLGDQPSFAADGTLTWRGTDRTVDPDRGSTNPKH